MVVIAAALAMLAGSAAHEQDLSPLTLQEYIDSLHWDPAKSGLLIAVDPVNVKTQSPSAIGLDRFSYKKIKNGNVTAFVQTWDIGLSEGAHPAPYLTLSDNEKVTFLIASLNPSEKAKLFGEGIAAQDLSGEPRAALLSMIPNPLVAQVCEWTGRPGFKTNGTQVQVSADQFSKVKLQFRKGIDFNSKPNRTGRERV